MLSTLSACGLEDLKKGVAVHKDGVYFTVYAIKRYAVAHGFDKKVNSSTYEIPSRVMYKGIKYPVKQFSVQLDGAYYTRFEIVHDGGTATKLIVPETVEKLDLSKYLYSQVENLQKITVSEDNKHLTSVDGVVYTKDKSQLIFYPPAKPDNTLVLPMQTTSISDYLYGKKNLAAIAVEAGNTSYSAHDGVLFTADGKSIVCYPLNKTDEKFLIPKSWSVLATSHFANNTYLKQLEVEEGNTIVSAYKGNLYSADGSTLLFRPNIDNSHVLELPDTINTVNDGMLYNVQYLYVPKGLQKIVFHKYEGYNDENKGNPIAKVSYIYFESEELPFCLRYTRLTGTVKFGVSREQFQAEIESSLSSGEHL